MSLSREAVLASRDLWARTEPVDCPDLGGAVSVRVLSLADLDRLSAALRGSGGNVENMAHIVVACACDGAGAPLFTPEDLDLVKAFPGRAVADLAKRAMALNRIGDADEADRKKD